MKLIATILTLCVVLASGTASADFAKAGAAITKGDYKTAYNEFLPLAEQGNVRAQYNIALMLDSGLGTELDYHEAAKWYRKAAEQGLPDAQHNLAVIYAGGKDIPQDLVQAYFWFDIAAASGMDTAKQNRDVTASHMTAEQIAEAKRLTQEWFAKRP
ncbi:MAG: sel1 repeat family protein [Sphingomonadales bacterium]|nr:sel1 repeat family protein [Sphingomonadales bacterium]